ncbi:MAG: PAS domain-containing protein [Pseudomonadota bacterium]|jgi:PAS domain S-box-containing protein
MTQQLLRHPERRPSVMAGGWDSEPAVLVMNTDGVIVQCDEAAERMFGYLSGELEGVPVSGLLPDLGGKRLVGQGSASIDSRLAYRCRCCGAFRAVRRDGSEFPTQLCLNIVRPADQHLVRMIVHPAQ